MDSAIPFNPAAVDIERLYSAAAGRLRRIVGSGVDASEATVDDACAVAWGQLVRHRHGVAPEAALSWLVRTAAREAVRLARRDQLEESLDAAVEAAGDAAWVWSGPGPEEQVEQRERLTSLGELPDRQQRILWLHAIGFSYAEIAAKENCTERTVERQLLRAKRAIRQLGGR